MLMLDKLLPLNARKAVSELIKQYLLVMKLIKKTFNSILNWPRGSVGMATSILIGRSVL